MIENVRQKILSHNEEVNEMYELINNFIKSNFKFDENSTYCFFPHYIERQALKIWYDSIQNIKENTNVTQINKNILIEIGKQTITTSPDEKELIINGTVLGKGIYANSAYDIRQSFISLLQNEKILQKMSDVVNTNLILNKDIETIVKDVKDISESIRTGYYKKKLSCCPTIFSLIRNIF